MPQAPVPDILPALPEIWLAVAAMLLLMVGAFRGNASTRMVSWLAVVAVAIAFVLVLSGSKETGTTFAGMFVVDSFSTFAKELILVGTAATLVMSMDYIRREGMERFEFPVLILLATIGMMMMVSANDLISLYVGIELQSLALYVIAAFKRDTLKSTEAGLKYFVLGALSSGMLLYGASLIYGFTGSTNFEAIGALYTQAGQEPSIGLIVGLVFLISGLAFKVSAVPFHMWTPDVYEGASTPATAFFAIAPKVAAMTLLVRVLIAPFFGAVDDWQQIITLIAILSMGYGAFAALRQANIKRLMAYSSIGHMGFALVGLAAGTEQGVQSVLIYLLIYLVMNIGAFAAILTMRVKGQMVEGIDDLAGLGRNNPMLALVLAILFFSLAGIPPLAGFFGKFYVFLAAIDAQLYTLAVLGVLSSVVGAYYYLRIIKVMYFDEPAESFERPIGREMTLILGASTLFTAFFVVFPGPFLAWTQQAAAALLP
ncbi:MAG: NADH-quinone oxidoreductase subunit NuoN [Proteobacteria bacterium]|nr:NADH-quinone oxidoreductase subunit NuoN [Pseudomonadota bacterium]MDA1058556.1 NADH-quinone oxidoreductase subunit NuoN [Pseudomonadota bacterium]